ncbi:MAG: hypothetical protein D6732_20410 [Methanobacteriota archaeon]|nr:MAG: hypothetical protein D6732_20410 [Euryarchaeota archaeon]
MELLISLLLVSSLWTAEGDVKKNVHNCDRLISLQDVQVPFEAVKLCDIYSAYHDLKHAVLFSCYHGQSKLETAFADLLRSEYDCQYALCFEWITSNNDRTGGVSNPDESFLGMRYMIRNFCLDLVNEFIIVRFLDDSARESYRHKVEDILSRFDSFFPDRNQAEPIDQTKLLIMLLGALSDGLSVDNLHRLHRKYFRDDPGGDYDLLVRNLASLQPDIRELRRILSRFFCGRERLMAEVINALTLRVKPIVIGGGFDPRNIKYYSERGRKYFIIDVDDLKSYFTHSKPLKIEFCLNEIRDVVLKGGKRELGYHDIFIFMNSPIVPFNDLVYDLYYFLAAAHKLRTGLYKVEYLHRYYVGWRTLLWLYFYLEQKDKLDSVLTHLLRNFPLGYDQEWLAERDMQLAIVAVGEVYDREKLLAILKGGTNDSDPRRKEWYTKLYHYLSASEEERKKRYPELDKRYSKIMKEARKRMSATKHRH